MPMPDLEWHLLPELPPAREAQTQTVNGRAVHVLPTERVMARTEDGLEHGAMFHHATKTFWTVGLRRDRALHGVLAWAFDRPLPPNNAA